jgi:hypothetical protein
MDSIPSSGVGGASQYLVNLPSRGTFTSPSISCNSVHFFDLPSSILELGF